MSSLARFHASAFAYVEDCAGGRQSFLKRNEKIKDKRMPRMSILRVRKQIHVFRTM